MSERAKRGDAAALAALRKADPVIAVMIDANPDFDPDGWLRLLPKMDEFGVLIFQVAGQQLSVAVTRTMLNRLTDQFGGKLPTPRQVLAADPESIRAAGFSHRKVQTLRELAQRFVDGRLDPKELRRLPDEEVVARLIEVPGVGRWTAEGFLTIALRRDDVVLAGDLALRKAIQQAYALDHLPSQSEVLAIAEPWRPYRGLGGGQTRRSVLVVTAYILIQTEVGKAAQVAKEISEIKGVQQAEDVTGPYDVIVRAEARNVDDLGKLVVARVQAVDGITRTLTCPVVHL